MDRIVIQFSIFVSYYNSIISLYIVYKALQYIGSAN